MNSLKQCNIKSSTDVLMNFLLFDIVSIVENYVGDCDIIYNNLSIPINYIDLRLSIYQ